MKRALALSLLLGASSAAALPNQVAQQGVLVDQNGDPVQGPVDLEVRIYDGAAGGLPLFSEVHPAVELFDGLYAIEIGAVEPLDPALFQSAELWIGFAVDGAPELQPRVQLLRVPGAMTAITANNAVGHITPKSVAISGVGAVIDAQGRWVGDPSGLVGPRGPQGPEGPQGPAGVAGNDGQAGANADPAAVVPLVVAALQANPNAMPYVRNDRDAAKAGSLVLNGGTMQLEGGDAVLNGGRLRFTPSNGRDVIDMFDNSIANLSLVKFADPGPDGALVWGGTQARLFVSPLDGANTDGYLRLINDAGIALESRVYVDGALGVGTITPEGAAEIRDDSAISTGMTVRNWRAGANTQPYLQLAGLTPQNQGAWGRMVLRTGAEAGGNNASNDGALQLVVSSGGAGAARTAMTVQHTGRGGVGTATPRGQLEVAGADSRSNPVVISSESPGLYLHDTETQNGALRYASFAVEADGSKLFIGSRGADVAATPGASARQFTVSSEGRVGINETSPDRPLVVRGDTLVDGDLTVTGTVNFARPSNVPVYVGKVAANQATAREIEIANFTINDHHWSTSNGFFVEAYSSYFDSGYNRYYVEVGYKSKEVRKIESRGDLATYFGLRLEEVGVIGQRGGHPERKYRLWAQARTHGQWNVFVRTASMRIKWGEANGDGELALKYQSDPQNVAGGSLSNALRVNSMEGDLVVDGGQVTHDGQRRMAARGICYSALTGNSNRSIIMVPLPNNQANLDAECHNRINDGWHAGGVAKANYFHQNCSDLNNDSYGGGYTSYVTEGYFEANRGLFTECNASNAFICCSPQFPN